MTTDTTFVVPPNSTGVYTIPVGVGGGGGIVNNGSGLPLPPPHLYPYDDSVLNHFIKDHEIQGQTLTVEHIMPIYSDIAFSKEDEAVIKAELMEKIVHELFKAKCIEFTRMKAADSDEMVYRARIHVVPDTQVRIIRELKNAGKTT